MDLFHIIYWSTLAFQLDNSDRRNHKGFTLSEATIGEKKMHIASKSHF